MSRLSAALLTWNYPPVPTGIGRAVAAIASGLVAADLDVRVFSSDRDPGTREEVDGVTVVGCAVPRRSALGLLRRRAAIGHIAAPLAFRSAVLAEHRRRPFDVIESTNWYAPAALLRVRRGPGQPALVVRNSTPAGKTAGPIDGMRDRVDHAFAHRLERRLVRRADHVVFNTAASAAILREFYALDPNQPSSVIGLALPDATIRAGAAAHYPDGGPLTLLFVGRAEPRKGFDELLGAFTLVRGREPDAVLHLVGTEPDDAASARQRIGAPAAARAGIIEHGRADDEAVHRLLAQCHMVVAPSRSESYGIVYREAAAFGRPLVASREDASAVEFVEATGAGILASATAPGPIADAIAALRADPALAIGRRAAGLAHAATLSETALGEATASVYRAAIAFTAAPLRATHAPAASDGR